jgi:TolA-binding protein
MRRVTCFSVVAVVLVFLMVTATHSQSNNSSRSGGSGGAYGSGSGEGPYGGGSGGGSGSFSGGGGFGTPDDFARDMAEQQRDFQQRMGRMQRQIEQMQRQAEEARNRAIQESLHATDAQWRQLKPKLDRIERLKTEANVAVDLSSFGAAPGFQGGGMTFGGTWGGGFTSGGGSGPQAPGRTQFQTWGTPARKSPMDMTPGEVLCDELGRLLQDPGAPASQVAQKVESLRKIRTRAREGLAQARTELRAQILLQQEPVLIAMGYLD